jgi:hypothetical protein
MMRMGLITLLFHMSLATVSALAESFDYEGSAIVDCVCPAPSGGSDCGVRRYQDRRYSFRIAVRPGLTGELSEACFRRRDRVVCCERPHSWYKGTIGKHCPGRPDCN